MATDHQGSQFTTEPPSPPADGEAVVRENVTCLARLSGEDGAGGAWTPGLGGPWTMDWEEAV